MTDRIPVIFIYCALLFSLAACSGRPSGVLSKEDMAQLLADMHTGEAVIESSSRTFPLTHRVRLFSKPFMPNME